MLGGHPGGGVKKTVGNESLELQKEVLAAEQIRRHLHRG